MSEDLTARGMELPALWDVPTAEEIRRELTRMVDSVTFRGAPRLTRFLTFVVEATLAGKADGIKAYTIAVDALGRGSDFDPQTDAIVRVQAGRLRSALARYYAASGCDDPLAIDLPRGTYVPTFRRRGAASLPAINTNLLGQSTAASGRRAEVAEARRPVNRLLTAYLKVNEICRLRVAALTRRVAPGRRAPDRI